MTATETSSFTSAPTNSETTSPRKGPRRNDVLIPFLIFLADVIGSFGAFHVAYHIRFSEIFRSIIPTEAGIPDFQEYFIGAVVIIPVWLMYFSARRVYKARKDTDFTLLFFTAVKQVAFGMLIVTAFAFFYRAFSYSRVVIAILWGTATVFLYLGRASVLAYERHLYSQGRELRNVLIVGVNALAQNAALRISQKPDAGYRMVGFVSDSDDRIESVTIPRVGGRHELLRIVEEHRVETILLMSDQQDIPLQEVQDQLIGKNIQILVQPELLGVTPTRLRIHEIFAVPFLSIKETPMTTWDRILKRGFDIAFSAFVMVITAPLMAVIAALIMLESGRPVIYTQVRVGLDGHEFDLRKFRTMFTDAETQSGPTWTRRGDPRVTRIGRFLRRSSLDELPQFLNVLKGEMSVVGPRPERPVFVNQFQSYIPRYMERHRMKTGLTGWAQVNGLRGEVPIAERTKYDIYYIENWSLSFDIRIVLKTLSAIIFGKDAY